MTKILEKRLEKIEKKIKENEKIYFSLFERKNVIDEKIEKILSSIEDLILSKITLKNKIHNKKIEKISDRSINEILKET